MFPPVFDKNTEVMIFGSYPGEESLRKQQYYGNLGNHFWRIMGEVLGEDLVKISYEERLKMLLKHKIGLWDTYDTVERKGSLDSAIKNAKMNDFRKLKDIPRLRLIAFNGQSSGKGEPHVAALGFRTIILPSSSAAHAISLSDKVKIWKSLVNPN